MPENNKVIKLVEESDNSSHWSPIDAIEQLLEDLKSGEVQPDSLIVSLFVDEGEHLVLQNYYCNVRMKDSVALLYAALQRATSEWLNA